MYTNYNLTDIVTRIRVKRLHQLLKESNYDQEKTEFLIIGFTEGFSIGYHGPRDRKHLSDNIPLGTGLKVELWNEVMKEVQLGCYAGPYSRPPYEHFIQLPIGLVPKDGGNKLDSYFIYPLTSVMKKETNHLIITHRMSYAQYSTKF